MPCSHHLIYPDHQTDPHIETKELKRRVRDIVDPDRDLGHVDGKKKSTSASGTEAARDASVQEPTQDLSDQGGESTDARDSKESEMRPLPVSRVSQRVKAEDGERKFTPMDLDVEEMVRESGDVKRNADGSICEDCN